MPLPLVLKSGVNKSFPTLRSLWSIASRVRAVPWPHVLILTYVTPSFLTQQANQYLEDLEAIKHD